MAGELTTKVMETVSTSSTTFYWGILALAFLLMVFMVWWVLSFKYRVVFRVITDNGKYIRQMKAKQVFRKGVHYWALFGFPPRLVSSPPKEAIHITKKGHFFAEAYVTEENPEPVWLKDTHKEQGAFDPLTTQERALHVAMLNEAWDRRKRGLMELLMQFGPMVILAIVVVVIVMFGSDLAKPVLEAQRGQLAIAEVQLEITKQQELIMIDLAKIMKVTNLSVSQEIPAAVMG